MKYWFEKGYRVSRTCLKNCRAEGIEFYCTMSETAAAWAERTMRSLKIILMVARKKMDESIFVNCRKSSQS